MKNKSMTASETVRTAKPKMTKALRRRVIFATVIAVIIISVALALTAAWFDITRTVDAGRLEMGTLDCEIQIYAADGVTEVPEEGSMIAGTNWADGRTGVAYIKITNTETIDAKAFIRLDCVNINNIDVLSLNYTYVKITDITSSVTDLQAYASSYTVPGAETIFQDTASVTINKLVENAKKLGAVPAEETKYYRFEYACYGLPATYAQQLNDANASFEAIVSIQQYNAPEEGEESNVYYHASSEADFLALVNIARNGDTIILDDDITLKNYNLTFYQRVNLDLNGYTLHVNGHMAYEYMVSGICTLNASGGSQLIVDGNLSIDTPNAKFTLTGGYNEVRLGSYDNENNVPIAGHFTVHTIRALNPLNNMPEGYLQTNAVIKKCTGINTNEQSVYDGYADIEVGSNTAIELEGSSRINDIKAMENAQNVAVINNATMHQIDLTETEYAGLYERQLYVCNGGTIGDATIKAVILPAWARGPVTTATAAYPNGYQVNAYIVKDAGYTGELKVAVKYTNDNLYYADDRATAISNGVPASIANNINFWDCDVGWNADSSIRVARNAANNYTVYLFESSETVKGNLDQYFSDNPGFAAEATTIDTLTIYTFNTGIVHTDGSTSADNDFVYLNGSDMQHLAKLDISKVALENNQIPAAALSGRSTLTEVALPITNNTYTIGGSAFYGTGVQYITLKDNVTAVYPNAFVPAGGAKCYVSWNSDNNIPESVLSGLSLSNNILFMEPYLLEDFLAGHSVWLLKAYEAYDIIDRNDNNYFYSLSADAKATLVYYRGTIPTSGAVQALAYGPNGVNYNVVAIGSYAFAESIDKKGSTPINSLSFPDLVVTVGKKAFFKLRVVDFNLNLVSSIGESAFENSFITNSAARPTSGYNGMVYLGARAFYGAQIGYQGADSSINNAAGADSNCITVTESGKYHSYRQNHNYNYKFGTLDLSGEYDIDVTALNGARFAGIELILDDVQSIKAIDGNGTFKNSKFYDCFISFNCVESITGNIFKSTTSNSVLNGAISTANLNHGRLDIRNVGAIEGMICSQSCQLDTIQVGLQADEYVDQATVNGIVYNVSTSEAIIRDTDLGLLDITGMLPSSCAPLYGYSSSGSKALGKLSVSDFSGYLGNSLFYPSTISTVIHEISVNSIGSLTIGDNCFKSVKGINSISIIADGEITLGSESFGSIKTNTGCDCDVNCYGAMNIGSSCFKSADIKHNLVLESNKSMSVGDNGFTSAKVGNNLSVESIGGTLSLGKNIVSSAAISNMSFSSSEQMTIGTNAFQSVDLVDGISFTSYNGSIFVNTGAFNSAKMKGSMTFSAPNGFAAADADDAGTGAFGKLTTYGTASGLLKIICTGNDINLGRSCFNGMTGSSISAEFYTSGWFNVREKAFFNTYLASFKRYGTYTANNWETTPCNRIDGEVGIYAFGGAHFAIGGVSLEGVKKVGSNAFNASQGVLTRKVLLTNSGLVSVGSSAFKDVTDIEEVHMYNITTLGTSPSYAIFENCSHLTYLEAPSLTNLNAGFSGCTMLTRIELGNASYSAYSSASRTTLENVIANSNNLNNVQIAFNNESTRQSFAANSTTYKAAYVCTTDIPAYDKATTSNLDEYTVNGVTTAPYLLRVINGKYVVVRVASKYTADVAGQSNKTDVSYNKFLGLTVPNTLNKMEKDSLSGTYTMTSTKNSISGIEYGAMKYVEVSGTLKYDTSISQFGYASFAGANKYELIAGGVNSDGIHVLGLRGDSNSVTALTFAGTNITLSAHAFDGMAAGNASSISFGNNPSFGDSAFSNATFTSLVELEISRTSLSSLTENLFTTCDFSNLKKLTVSNFNIGENFMAKSTLTALREFSFTKCEFRGEGLFEGYSLTLVSTPVTFTNCDFYVSFPELAVQTTFVSCAIKGTNPNKPLTFTFSTNSPVYFTNSNGENAKIKMGASTTGLDSLVVRGGIWKHVEFNVESGAVVSFKKGTGNCSCVNSTYVNTNNVGTKLDMRELYEVCGYFIRGTWEEVYMFNGTTSQDYQYNISGPLIQGNVYTLYLYGSIPTSASEGTMQLISGKIGTDPERNPGIVLGTGLNTTFSCGDRMPAAFFQDANLKDVEGGVFTTLMTKFDDMGNSAFVACTLPDQYTCLDLYWYNITATDTVFLKTRSEGLTQIMFKSNDGNYTINGRAIFEDVIFNHVSSIKFGAIQSGTEIAFKGESIQLNGLTSLWFENTQINASVEFENITFASLTDLDLCASKATVTFTKCTFNKLDAESETNGLRIRENSKNYSFDTCSFEAFKGHKTNGWFLNRFTLEKNAFLSCSFPVLVALNIKATINQNAFYQCAFGTEQNPLSFVTITGTTVFGSAFYDCTIYANAFTIAAEDLAASAFESAKIIVGGDVTLTKCNMSDSAFKGCNIQANNMYIYGGSISSLAFSKSVIRLTGTTGFRMSRDSSSSSPLNVGESAFKECEITATDVLITDCTLGVNSFESSKFMGLSDFTIGASNSVVNVGSGAFKSSEIHAEGVLIQECAFSGMQTFMGAHLWCSSLILYGAGNDAMTASMFRDVILYNSSTWTFYGVAIIPTSAFEGITNSAPTIAGQTRYFKLKLGGNTTGTQLSLVEDYSLNSGVITSIEFFNTGVITFRPDVFSPSYGGSNPSIIAKVYFNKPTNTNNMYVVKNVSGNLASLSIDNPNWDEMRFYVANQGMYNAFTSSTCWKAYKNLFVNTWS